MLIGPRGRFWYRRINVPNQEKGAIDERRSIIIKNNQWEAILLQDVTNHREFKFPILKKVKNSNKYSYE